MTLFTKEDCKKCDNIKNAFDLEHMGINIEVITAEDPDILAHLAWHELVDLVDMGALPILVLDDGSHIKYELPIRKYLKKNFSQTTH